MLDVVLNHTGEGDRLGPTVSLRGLDNATYYRLAPDDPGSSSTMRAAATCWRSTGRRCCVWPWTALRAWARARRGGRVPPRSRHHARPARRRVRSRRAAAGGMPQDPVLRDRAIIAEPWDIGPGGYRLGAFPAGWGEWNDRYRDTVRRFWRGDGGMLGELATRFAGIGRYIRRSPARSRAASISSPPMTASRLADLVAYDRKHNDGEWRGQPRRHRRQSLVEQRRRGAERRPGDPRGARRAMCARCWPRCCSPAARRCCRWATRPGAARAATTTPMRRTTPCPGSTGTAMDADLFAFTARLVQARRECPALRGPAALTGAAVDESGVPDVVWHAADGQAMTPGQWRMGRTAPW